MMKLLLMVAVLAGLGTHSGCGARQDNNATDGEAESAVTQAVTGTSVNLNPVDHIVFVGLQESCACTRNRINESWRVLQNSLATAPEISVQRIQRDVDKKAALELHRLKPLLVAPGLYFLDAENQLIGMLQGEVSAQQLSTLLQPTAD